MVDVVHVAYPGIGGQAGVAVTLAQEATRKGESHAIVFYGIESPAQQYVDACDSAGIRVVGIRKSPGFGIGARRRLLAALRELKPAAVLAHIPDTATTAWINRSASTLAREADGARDSRAPSHRASVG